MAYDKKYPNINDEILAFDKGQEDRIASEFSNFSNVKIKVASFSKTTDYSGAIVAMPRFSGETENYVIVITPTSINGKIGVGAIKDISQGSTFRNPNGYGVVFQKHGTNNPVDFETKIDGYCMVVYW